MGKRGAVELDEGLLPSAERLWQPRGRSVSVRSWLIEVLGGLAFDAVPAWPREAAGT